VIDNRMLANLLEGLVRLAIFMAYILSIAQMKEIRRVRCYHGAEHRRCIATSTRKSSPWRIAASILL
jgi:uncharacterized protein YqhQ